MSANASPGSSALTPAARLCTSRMWLGTGGGAHAPDEYFVIESSNPKVAGLTGQTMAYVDLLYEIAARA